MDKKEKRQYVRLIYQKAFRSLGVMLVMGLGLGTLLGGGIYLVNALCALGFVMLCRAWFIHLKLSGMRPFSRPGGKKEKKVPYLYRRLKEKKPHRPSFRMDAADFDDDLVADTMTAEENFTPIQADRARAIASLLCGAALIAASFLIPI